MPLHEQAGVFTPRRAALVGVVGRNVIVLTYNAPRKRSHGKHAEPACAEAEAEVGWVRGSDALPGNACTSSEKDVGCEYGKSR